MMNRSVATLGVALGLLVGSGAMAACPGACPIPGGGSPTKDCLVEFQGASLNFPLINPREVQCTDGDPTCDGDGAANGSCRFQLSVCVNNTDPRFPACVPSDVSVLQVRNGKLGSRGYNAQLADLQTAVNAIPIPTSSALCSAYRPINVPMRASRGLFRNGKMRVKTKGKSVTGATDSDKVKLVCVPSPTFPGPDATYARARVITQPAELIDGVLSRGRLGDILLANDDIQVVIQQPGRALQGIGAYGGNIIDADRQRTTGNERDNFEEMSLGLNIENTANYTNVSVLNDGTNNLPAVVRATGPDDLLDFINPSTVVANFGFAFPVSADDQDLPVDIQTDYILEAGKPYVRLETTITNLGGTPLDLYMAEYLNGSGQLEQFQPGNGFGEPLITTTCAAGSYVTCTSGTCDLCPMVAYAGVDGGEGVSYGYFAPYNGSTSFSTSGVTVPLLGREAVLVLIGASPPNFHIDAAGGPGDSLVVTRYFGVGDGTVSSLQDMRNQIYGVATGTVSGTVTSGGLPIKNADVAALATPTPGGFGRPVTNVFDHFRTDADGKFQGTLPPGAYTLRANKDGRLAASPASANITVTAAGSVVQNFTIPTTGSIRVTAEDELGSPIPAKVQLVGFDPTPDPLNTQSVLGLINTTTGVFGEELEDGTQFGIAEVFFAGADGDTGVQNVEPGTYQVAVSRGPRYSAFTQSVTVTAGSTTTVNAQIARVIDTAGFVASDFHIHGINSPDAEVTTEERVVTEAAEGMDFMAPSDHDIRVDYAPAIAALGLSSEIASTINQEITTFDYGHFNSWPLTINPAMVNGGALDWGRAGVAPGMDYPSALSFNLSPAEIYVAAHADPKQNLIQINHMRSHFNTDGLDIDTAMTPPQSHTPASTRRLDPGVGNFFDAGFDALEVWIGTDGRTGDQAHFVGENMGDWFNMLNQGILRTGVANSDTHERKTTQINARTFVASAVTSPALLSAEDETLAGNVVEGRAIGTNGPFVGITAATPSTGQVAGLAIGQPTLAHATDGNVTVTVTVRSPRWAEFDRVELYVNNAPQPYDHDAKPATRDRYRVIPNQVKNAPADFTVTEVNDFPAIPGARHLEATATFNLALTQDAWLMVLVRGTDGVSRPLFPFIPNSLQKAGNTTLGNLTDGNLNESGVVALAFTNPLYIDFDNNGTWTPPGVMLTPP
jgi:Carboxypeptidase regulatory-like domain